MKTNSTNKAVAPSLEHIEKRLAEMEELRKAAREALAKHKAEKK